MAVAGLKNLINYEAPPFLFILSHWRPRLSELMTFSASLSSFREMNDVARALSNEL